MPTLNNRAVDAIGASRGAAILGAVVLLLGLASLVILYTGQIQSMQFAITLNNINHYQATVAAQSALRLAIKQLPDQQHWPQSEFTMGPTLIPNTRVNIQQVALQTLDFPARLVQLEARGMSLDTLNTQRIHATALLYPILRNLPDAAVTINGPLASDSQLELVANANGAGTGLAVSAWSNNDIDLHPDSISCYWYEYQQGQCQQAYLSKGAHIGPDIIANSSAFPTDLLEYLFGIPKRQLAVIQAFSHLKSESCDGVTDSVVGLLWIKRNCELHPQQRIGSFEQPVIMLIEQGDLIMHQDASVYGLVVCLSRCNIKMQRHSAIIGAAVLVEGLNSAANLIKVHFNTEVVERLQHRPLLTSAVLLGSLRDYQ